MAGTECRSRSSPRLRSSAADDRLLPIRELRFQLALERPLTVTFPGPTIRGMIGHGLKATACRHAPDWRGRCSHGAGCAYAEIFDAACAESRERSKWANRDWPAPMVLRVGWSSWRGEESGDQRTLGFVVRLLGHAARHSAAVAEAVFSRQPHGLGAKGSSFVVESFRCDELLEDSATRPILEAVCPSASRRLARTTIRFHLRSPYCHRVGGRPRSSFDAPAFVRAARERVDLLRSAYGTGGRDEYPPEPAEPVEFSVVRSQLSQWRHTRSSSRQGLVPIEGLVGEVDVHGPWGPEVWWLREMGRVGVGKYANFGLGEVTMEGTAE